MHKIAQGAEAVLYKEQDSIIKERLIKGYRIPQIDDSIRKFRTRREAKILQKLEELHITAPRLKEISEKKMTVTMDFVEGQKVRDVLESSDYKKIAFEIGTIVAKMHQNDLIHGDLTTSNMIEQKNGKIAFIDFGLSFFSDKVEDKAVDLHLMDRCLESKHFRIYPAVFEAVLEGYHTYLGSKAVLQRFKSVSGRGRNKKK